jgi:hypothetical protein
MADRVADCHEISSDTMLLENSHDQPGEADGDENRSWTNTKAKKRNDMQKDSDKHLKHAQWYLGLRAAPDICKFQFPQALCVQLFPASHSLSRQIAR